jgi:hypothetical protein
MSVMIQGSQVRAITQGILVSRATATIAADQDLFSIDGGRILLLGFVGTVTTAIGAGSQDFGIAFDPDDGGSNVDLADTSTPLVADADVVGTHYTLNTTAAGDLVAATDVAYNAILATPILLPEGDIVLDVTGTEAGSVKWDLIYVPLDNGASVSAS